MPSASDRQLNLSPLLVNSDEMGFGFTHVMTMFEELYDVYLNVKAFKSIQGAMDWLEQG